MPSTAASPIPGHQLELLDRLSGSPGLPLQLLTEQSYRHWVKRVIFFRHVRHPAQMADAEINVFPSHLAVEEKVSALPWRERRQGSERRTPARCLVS